MSFRSTGSPLAVSRVPTASQWTTCPRRATIVITAASRPSSTYACMAGPMRASASADMPTASGAATGSPASSDADWAGVGGANAASANAAAATTPMSPTAFPAH